MDENGEILLLHASKNNARPLVLPWFNDFDPSPFHDLLYLDLLKHTAHSVDDDGFDVCF